MKRDKIVYWSTTGLVALGMIASGVMYLTRNPEVIKGFETIGYPMSFVNMLGIAKVLGAVVLLAPVSNRIKEWAYAGFAFTFMGATWTHIATNTPFLAPLIFLGILGVSYWFWGRMRAEGQLARVNAA